MIYEEQANRGVPNAIDQFSYAYALIKSTKGNVRTGISLLQRTRCLSGHEPTRANTDSCAASGLINRDAEEVPKRDCIYYLAIAHMRLKEYDMALHHINQLLSAEADNRQVLELKELVERRAKKGMVLVADCSYVSSLRFQFPFRSAHEDGDDRRRCWCRRRDRNRCSAEEEVTDFSVLGVSPLFPLPELLRRNKLSDSFEFPPPELVPSLGDGNFLLGDKQTSWIQGANVL